LIFGFDPHIRDGPKLQKRVKHLIERRPYLLLEQLLQSMQALLDFQKRSNLAEHYFISLTWCLLDNTFLKFVLKVLLEAFHLLRHEFPSLIEVATWLPSSFTKCGCLILVLRRVIVLNMLRRLAALILHISFRQASCVTVDILLHCRKFIIRVVFVISSLSTNILCFP
jgi:hypothetical protein